MVGDKLPSSGGIMPLMPAYRYRFPDSNDGSDAAERAASANEPGRITRFLAREEHSV
ncbi:hypothetical protein DO71_1341 [Burkholderia pseudomallei]|nr:hypothetical protein DO71_1341 [Burkholderia pseudomallei]